MAKSIQTWLDTDVAPYRDKPQSWLAESHFFRDPSRPVYSDLRYFFSPADGIILYQRTVKPDECLLDIKGRSYSLRDALRDPTYDKESYVVGIFMTFYDVHVNRVPYPGRLSFRELDPLDTHNHPMLDVEKGILDDLRVPTDALEYLHHNQRFVNRVDSAQLGGSYYLLQIADYDVDCITPFSTKQNQRVDQCQRFSQIRYGSQVDLVVPLSSRFALRPIHSTGDHVEAGVDPLIEIQEHPRTLA
jgi:phosphatidylserine decarboxylase